MHQYSNVKMQIRSRMLCKAFFNCRLKKKHTMSQTTACWNAGAEIAKLIETVAYSTHYLFLLAALVFSLAAVALFTLLWNASGSVEV